MDRHTTSGTNQRGTTEADQRRRPAMDRRAISEVLGFALVFALIVSLVILVSVVGFDELEDTRDREELNNAERAFDVLADNMADIHAGGAPSRATEINLESAQLEVGDQVTFNVTGIRGGNSSTTELVAEPIVLTTGDAEIVYSFGAVFRTQRDGGVILRPPPMRNSSTGVILSAVQTRMQGDVVSTGGTTVRIRAENQQRRAISGFTENPATFDEIQLTVTSPRSDLWMDYFESQSLDCTSVAADSVRCTITDPEAVFTSRTVINYAFES